MREIGELRRGRVQVHAEIGGSRGKLPDAAGEGKERHRNAPGLCNNSPVAAPPAPVMVTPIAAPLKGREE
jgi:hypothetical protein